MTKQTILITGATSGIGLAGAENLGHQGWRVLVHARNQARGQPVVDGLRARNPGGTFDLVTGDLTELGQVALLADQVKALVPSLDVLWNNAGIMVTEGQLSADGFELQWAVNHLAPFFLTSRLLTLVQAAPQGRIVQTSSFAHHSGKVPASFAPAARYNGWTTYGSTKLANILFTKELAERLSSTQVTVHAFHPGYVRTSFGANGDPTKGNSGSLLAFAQIPVEAGADTGVFLATEEAPGRCSGLYWSTRRVRKGSRRITADNARRLWELTETALEGKI